MDGLVEDLVDGLVDGDLVDGDLADGDLVDGDLVDGDLDGDLCPEIWLSWEMCGEWCDEWCPWAWLRA